MPARPRWARGASSTSASWRASATATSACWSGFTTYDGHVTAASNWGERPRAQACPAGAAPTATKRCSTTSATPNFWLATSDCEARRALRAPRLERAIGVIYRPETERQSHYFEARLADQFDAVIHFDHTRAVEPLERTAFWDRLEPPETYPTGI